MRAAAVLALLVPAASLAAPAQRPHHAPPAVAGSPFRDVIWQPPVRATSAPVEPVSRFTSVSRTLYLNPCLPDGCLVQPGSDDSRYDSSSILQEGDRTLAAWPHGPERWTELVQCVRDLYAPFDIDVTDVDPGMADHFEVIVAGYSNDLGVPGAGGVAPYIPCDGQLEDNGLSFVFGAQLTNFDFMCWAAAQESAHVWGLDHELDARDPMTYLAPPYKKPGFQDVDAPCGEDLTEPRECWCGGTTQNSYQYLMDTFGPRVLEPASVAFVSPTDGRWVKPGFPVVAELSSQLSMTEGSLAIDGASPRTVTRGEDLAWTTSTTLTAGVHRLTVTARDVADRTVSSEISVTVTARCDPATVCAQGTYCLGGYCLPGASVAGGLGAPCTGGDQCITGTCGDDGTQALCAGTCDGGTTCPGGFTCLVSETGGLCWPAAEQGGCSTSDPGTPLLALLGLGALARRGRRRR
jgi:MYXO-CTERM domain-containing protein